MDIRAYARKIRPAKDVSMCRKALNVLFAFLLGVGFGILAKMVDNMPTLGEVGTRLGFWILTGAIIAVWSPTPLNAAGKTFAFFVAMLGAYYAYTVLVYRFFPQQYVIVWGSYALLSPISGFIAWYGRGTGWVAAICAALPIALLTFEGYSFGYTFSIPSGLALAGAVFLLATVPLGWRQKGMTAGIAAVAFLILRQLNIMSLLFGGL